ncbi:hypothetical protein [Bradyrhizobium arachidis]|uniref:Uncharacterized protein n=1 Tax=Bradyrhizobium arachidis TaxID=858423 RepID=A0AAE7NWR8_9BRAD|nr:hypothetical protein [Bradyrhizobium arachidis]QOZ71716.1 hypothetical protein WN72_39555 [Bradyrhizobium arachidis]SFV19158.1 hypothetical protein SAMN05192541_14634 [Bradyrhizobium arachidis]
MGIELVHSPKYFRKRAGELRTKADNAQHRQAKEALRRVAKTYDDLARRAEQIRTALDCSVALEQPNQPLEN